MDGIKQFAAAMRSHGLSPPESLIADGQLHRFASNGRRGDDAGWYTLHTDGIPAGVFGDWRTGVSQKWRADIGRPLTPTEEATHQARVDSMRRVRKAEQVRRHTEATSRAAAIIRARSRRLAITRIRHASASRCTACACIAVRW